ncbi:MAG TPA: DUF4411 family protein [Candidatus Bathyarchaeia archaeon]|nr:DUF4411 family protein [Candidatus Bathyarchaeia archaeon]
MKTTSRTFLLDANVFIQAKNSYYALALCPRFWASLKGSHEAGHLYSIDHIKRELLLGKDDLASWAEQTLSPSFFHSTTDAAVMSQYRDIMTWVQDNTQFFDSAKSEFATAADGWLVAYAKAKGHVVVTHEQLRPEAKNRVLIPNVCKEFGVDYTDTFQMLKSLGVRFVWDAAP